ncbi:MAG: hypothetical protein ACE5E5_15160 [Phycisphaerae bacterium]
MLILLRACFIIGLVIVWAYPCPADGVLYRYEADVFPYEAGWSASICDAGCVESLEDGHYVTTYAGGTDSQYLYHYWVDRVGSPPAPPHAVGRVAIPLQSAKPTEFL